MTQENTQQKPVSNVSKKRKPKTQSAPKQGKTELSRSFEVKSGSLIVSTNVLINNQWHTLEEKLEVSLQGLLVKGKTQEFMDAYTKYVSQLTLGLPSAIPSKDAAPTSRYYKKIVQLAQDYLDSKKVPSNGSSTEKTDAKVSKDANGETPSAEKPLS